MTIKGQTFKSLISKCNIKKRGLVIVEGHTDKKIYDKIIHEAITRDNKKYEIKSVKEFEEINSGGCNQIINLLELNKDYLESNPITKEIVLAFIDGDAKLYRGENRQLCEFEDFIFKLRYYSIESYCFSEKCLQNILEQYLVGTEGEISKFTPVVYKNIIENISENAFNLAILCILNDRGIIDSDLSYGTSEGIFTEGERFYDTLNKEREIYKEQINSFINEQSLECNFETIKIITKGKHLLYLISKELSNQINLLNNEKVCNTYLTSKSFEEICCTKINECSKEKCSLSLEYLPGNPFRKGVIVSIFNSSIKKFIDHNECVEIVNALQRVIYI